jgi:site-specific DNA recombinase
MRAALYVRVSTQDQAEKFSLPAQRAILTEHCDRQGWAYEVYEDAGISGETIDERPAMVRLLRDAEARRFDIVLAVELERFSRSTDLLDWLRLKKTFRKSGIRFGTPGQTYDPADVEDDFLSDLFGSLAKREKQKIVQRTLRGKVQAARQGKYLAPVPPFGYRSERGSLLLHEPEAAVVRRIFGLARRGESIRGIARLLNEEDAPTPFAMRGDLRAGKQWGKSSIARILTNTLNTGSGHWNRRQRIGKVQKFRPESQWVAVRVPAIIDADEFQVVQERLRRNAALAARHQHRVYMLKGIIYCACGRRMYGQPDHGRRYYECAARRNGCDSRMVRAERIEDAVWSETLRALQDPQSLLEMARKQRAQFGEHDEVILRLDAVNASLAKLPESRARIVDAFEEGTIDKPEFKSRLQRLDDRRQRLEGERESLTARLGEQAAGELDAETFVEALNMSNGAIRFPALVGESDNYFALKAGEDVDDMMQRFNEESRASLVRAVMRKVTVDTDGLTFEGILPLDKNAFMRTLWPPAAAISSARRAYA